MPIVPPILLLLVLLGLTLVPVAASLLAENRRRAQLRAVAQQYGCRFETQAPAELLRAAADHLPLGAADVRALNTVVCESGESRGAVVRFDYTLGSVRHRRDETRVAWLTLDGSGAVAGVLLAAPDEPLVDAYRSLLEQHRSVTA